MQLTCSDDLVSIYSQLESNVEICDGEIASLKKPDANQKSSIVNQPCTLEERELSISTHLFTISTKATTILDNELAKQLLAFTISSQEQSIFDLC